MTERNPFERMPRTVPAGLQCEEWEAMLADALDGTLPANEGAAFHSHGSDCAACAEVLKHARQGREWLAFLHEEPQVPVDLHARILARTSGLGRAAAIPVAQPVPAIHMGHFSSQRAFLKARFLMTAAMAFFSIGITLNLAGVKLTELRLSDLKPANMQANLSRQFYGAKGEVVRYYDNLRVVYEVEARMRELRRDSDTAPATSAPARQEKSDPKGSARKNGSRMNAPEGALDGLPVLARNDPSAKSKPSSAAAALALCEFGSAEGGLL